MLLAAECAMNWRWELEQTDCGARDFATSSDGDSLRTANAASYSGCLVRDDSVLIAPGRPVHFNSLALSRRYLSIARRMSSATGAPVFSDSFCSLLICSSLRKRAARFMTI
jgi:hypothetical protein